jgi:RimJ/RimL family protein N-acetyltransferase
VIPLPPTKFADARLNVRRLPINTLFVESILCRHVDGAVFVDDPSEPSAFYAIHPYGMSLLWGRASHDRWHDQVRAHLRAQRSATEWLQVYPNAWVELVESALVGERHTRVNFEFDREAYLRVRPLVADAMARATIVPTTAELFSRIEGSVVPQRFWRDASQFIASGGGFTMIDDGNPVASAFCSYRHDDAFEIGVETSAVARGRGYARLVASRLIDDCLEHGRVPVWACRLENVGSYRLALSLGFKPVRQLPYYRLSA